MPVAVTFNRVAMTSEQYDECMRQLEAAGEGSPSGRLYHVCYVTGGRLRVLDVWDSAESFARFGQTLLPILRGIGIDPGEPVVGEVHNVVEG
ncbi:MAG TPA: hypothetical protein VGV38_03505 [Pyrinomonadaceae bacterium]|nr:hypothetical protein [Pyrinomonadaceae bacterium]